jgi:hypothetical protein
LLWAVWVPLCFLTIPPVHYLCRYVIDLRERISALEKIVVRGEEPRESVVSLRR